MKTNSVINWHLLEPCQLKCKYCYAQWEKSSLKEVFRDKHLSHQLIKEIATLADDRSVRLSFAGGEPLLDKYISQKIQWAAEESLSVSLITNGDFLRRRLIPRDLLNLSILGVSIDSFSIWRNREIGRATLSGRTLDYEEIVDYLQHARKINPKIKIKINTVVNRFNFNDDLSIEIDRIKPDKWKVLRVLPTTEKSRKQAITDNQFQIFKEKHKHIDYVQFEDNEDMYNSYLMIDPYGRFFFNSKGQYRYTRSILDVGIEKALQQVTFDEYTFRSRYPGGVK